MWFGFNEINNRCTSIMVSESLTQGFDFYVFTVYSFGFVMVIVVKPVYFVSCVLYYWRFCICHLAFQFLVSLQMIIPFCVRSIQVLSLFCLLSVCSLSIFVWVSVSIMPPFLSPVPVSSHVLVCLSLFLYLSVSKSSLWFSSSVLLLPLLFW